MSDNTKGISFQFLFTQGLKLLKHNLPTDIADLFDEFNDPELYEPYLQEMFFALFKAIEIPPAEIKFGFGYNGEAKKIIYNIWVINIHENKWREVEFPLGTIFKNMFKDQERTQVFMSIKEAIIIVRNYKKESRQVEIPLPDGSVKILALPG